MRGQAKSDTSFAQSWRAFAVHMHYMIQESFESTLSAKHASCALPLP